MQKVQAELEGLQKELGAVSDKTEAVLAGPQPAGAGPILRSELDLTLKKMEAVYGLSAVYLDR